MNRGRRSIRRQRRAIVSVVYINRWHSGALRLRPSIHQRGEPVTLSRIAPSHASCEARRAERGPLRQGCALQSAAGAQRTFSPAVAAANVKDTRPPLSMR